MIKNALKFNKTTINVSIVTLCFNFMDENFDLKVGKENNFLVCHLLSFITILNTTSISARTV